jgi:flavodoxin
MKALIAYYSYRGNTERIAELIAKETGADTLRIETVVPYEGSYNKVVNQGQDEVNAGYRPAIKPLSIDLSKYDTIILGTPVWWHTFAPAMHTFLKSQDWSVKNLYPFATNGGWIGHTFKDFKNICTGAEMKSGLNVRFDEATLRTSMKDIENWIHNIPA